MTKQEIISAYEDFDRVLLEFAKEIEQFAKDIQDNDKAILELVSEIGAQWKLNGYTDFKANIGGKIDRIENALSRCETIGTAVKEASVQLNEQLAIMREKA